MRLFAVILCALFVVSCAPSPQNVSFSQANQTFLKYCQEYKYDCVLREAGNTLWIYLPLEQELVGIKASMEGPSSSNESNASFTVKYLESEFRERTFTIEYDIEKTFSYSKQFGYESAYTEKFQEIQNALLSIIKQSYFDVPKAEAPEFIYFVIADTKNGIETENLLYLDDFKRAMSTPPSFTQEEYAKRYISQLRGHQNIIADKTGAHLKVAPVTLGEFLAKQMVNRINFKYQRSMFPPSEDTKNEILEQVKETLNAYSFDGYENVVLKDLGKGGEYSFSRSQL
ncbi:MAG TPA: hypothetical protein VI749_09405 [Candidatus Omnitrophota bacterium]|nr:hypothetical protein [Candidatus Omnitrophota bacterium]